MVMKNRLLVATCASVTLVSGAAIAHHGWGSYDASRTMIVDSSVRRLAWQNPHVQIDVNHAGATWELVLAPPFRMSARGLDAEMIKIGTRVRAEGYPSTRNAHEMRAERIAVDGKIYELR
jgi:hypothetical protein